MGQKMAWCGTADKPLLRSMGLLPDTKNCGLRMHRECRERFPRHWLKRKPLVSDSGMHHGACIKHVPWWMSGSLTGGSGENGPGIPGACATRNFTYLARGPWLLFVDWTFGDIIPWQLGWNKNIFWVKDVLRMASIFSCRIGFIRYLNHCLCWMSISYVYLAGVNMGVLISAIHLDRRQDVHHYRDYGASVSMGWIYHIL